ncbi:MAG: DUF2975 domain-containing protein [Clostridiaceae bacterium]
MKENKYNSMSRFLIVVLNLLIAFGVLAFISIVISTLSAADIGEGNRKYIVNCILLFTGTSALVFILYSLRKILKSVIKEGPFNMAIVKSLKNIAFSSFFITICYLINFFYNNQFKSFSLINIGPTGIHTDTEFLIFFFSGCFVLILAQIYKQAVEVKEENDFTV